MRVVLDTNVIISAVLTARGVCARIVDMVGESAFELCADDRILDEYDSVLRRPEFGMTPTDVDVFMEMVRHAATLVVAPPLAAELPDPDDLPFLEVAAACDALLVTGNARHFPESTCAPVRVLSPGEFVAILRHMG